MTEDRDGIYLKLFVDSIERYSEINDAEFGRLIRAALAYKADGTVMELTGREKLYWNGIRLDIDRDNRKQAGISASRSEAGQKGAASRWDGKIANNGKNSKSHLPYGKNGNNKDKDKDKDNNSSLTESNRAGAGLDASIKEFVAFRKAIKKPMTDRAVSMLKTKLEKLAPGNDEMKIQLLETSIYKGWLDVYPPDDEKQTEVKTTNPFYRMLIEEGGAV